ncbi:MAG TPA: ATP-binding protein [Verrucomicrobiae bacterium]|nr:ATP-binding protein [Verrucomicrobiae bacterium]
MKSLSLTTPLVIIMTGLPGAGKSFFARQFADMFRAPLVSVDKLRYEILENPTFSPPEQQQLATLADYQIEETMKTQQTIIVDGYPATRIDRLRLEKLAKKHGYKNLLIWVQTDEATAKFRATKRSPQTQEETSSRNIQPDQFSQLAKRFVAPTPSEAYVVISGKHTYATQAKVVLKKLTENRPTTTTIQPPAPERSVNPPLSAPRRSIIIG